MGAAESTWSSPRRPDGTCTARTCETSSERGSMADWDGCAAIGAFHEHIAADESPSRRRSPLTPRQQAALQADGHSKPYRSMTSDGSYDHHRIGPTSKECPECRSQ